MRNSKQYSIIDHQFLHRGCFHSLSHEALSLYFFLVTVGDKSGRSYYSEVKIIEILRLSDFEIALFVLCNLNLIVYQRPYFWVRDFEQVANDPHLIESRKLQREIKKDFKKLNSNLNSAREVLRNILKD
jgi:hypothetical protein